MKTSYIHLRNIRSETGNVVLMVSFFSLIALGFFIFLSSSMMKMLNQTFNLRNSYLATYAAESAIEQSIVEYFQNADDIPTTYEDHLSNICINSDEPDQSLVDFFNCAGGDNIGTIEKNVSRYQTKLTGFLDRYQSQEFWFTDKESESDHDVSDIESLKLDWNTSDISLEKAGITLTIARWPKDTPQNIQTNHLILDPADGKQSIDIRDFRRASGTDNGETFKMGSGGFNYLIIIKAHDLPTHFELSSDDSLLPSKDLTIQVKTVLEDERDPTNTITRQFEVVKEIYTNRDSNFPYVRHLL